MRFLGIYIVQTISLPLGSKIQQDTPFGAWGLEYWTRERHVSHPNKAELVRALRLFSATLTEESLQGIGYRALPIGWQYQGTILYPGVLRQKGSQLTRDLCWRCFIFYSSKKIHCSVQLFLAGGQPVCCFVFHKINSLLYKWKLDHLFKKWSFRNLNHLGV